MARPLLVKSRICQFLLEPRYAALMRLAGDETVLAEAGLAGGAIEVVLECSKTIGVFRHLVSLGFVR